MFTARYFTPRYFTPRFWPPAGVGVLVEVEFGGRQFVGFIPLSEMLQRQIPVSAEVVKYTRETETELVIEGKKYELVAERTPSQIIREFPGIDDILDDAVEKLGTSRRKARKDLYNLVIEELKAAEDVKRSVFQDDEEILMILVATDDI